MSKTDEYEVRSAWASGEANDNEPQRRLCERACYANAVQLGLIASLTNEPGFAPRAVVRRVVGILATVPLAAAQVEREAQTKPTRETLLTDHPAPKPEIGRLQRFRRLLHKVSMGTTVAYWLETPAARSKRDVRRRFRFKIAQSESTSATYDT